jgi:hypothetical protein
MPYLVTAFQRRLMKERLCRATRSKAVTAATLSQIQEGVENPISYASRQLNKAEQNYLGSELEMLAVAWEARNYRCYVYGKSFIVRTDHAALK